MLAIGIIHGISDGLTVSSTGVAVGMSAPAERQAGAQGMLGAAETLTGGITSVMAGALYTWGGRSLAYSVCAGVMVVMAVTAYVLAGPTYRAMRGSVVGDVTIDPAAAVTGHA
jgi:hypothetical protein